MSAYRRRYASVVRVSSVHAGRLWNGGLSTSLVATCLALARIPLSRTVSGVWGGAGTGWYALGVEAAGLGATGLMHLLIAVSLRPFRVFAWVMALGTATAMLVPFVTAHGLARSTVTAGLNLLLGTGIATLVAGAARTAMDAAEPAGPDP